LIKGRVSEIEFNHKMRMQFGEMRPKGDEELYENFRKVVEGLASETSEKVVVLVEGARDEKVLRLMGYRGRVIYLSRLREKLEAAGELEKIILLLDFDREGMKNMKKLSMILTSMGYKIDSSYHQRLRPLKRLGINTVEDLQKLLLSL